MVVIAPWRGRSGFASVEEDDDALESPSHQTSPDLGYRNSRTRNNFVWFRASARVPTNIRFPRQAPGAKVMAVLVGETERDTRTAVFGNASQNLEPGAEEPQCGV